MRYRQLLAGRGALYAGAILTVVIGIGGVAADTGGGGPLINTSSSAEATSTATLSTAATPVATATPTAAADTTATTQPAGIATTDFNGNRGGAGANNVIRVVNQVNGELRVRGRVQLNQITAPNVAPQNLAYAFGSCVNCQTLAVALQINLFSKSATFVSPKNLAIALNYRCTDCITVARAMQYDYSVDDPGQIPSDVSDLIHQMNQALTELQTEKGITVSQAEAQINAIASQFQQLAQSLDDKRDVATDPTSPNATPLATASATPGTALPTSSAQPTDAATVVTETPVATPDSSLAPTTTPTSAQ